MNNCLPLGSSLAGDATDSDRVASAQTASAPPVPKTLTLPILQRQSHLMPPSWIRLPSQRYIRRR